MGPVPSYEVPGLPVEVHGLVAYVNRNAERGEVPRSNSDTKCFFS